MKHILTTIGAFLIGTTILSAQSAWTKKKGDTYTQLTYSTISNYNSLFGNPDYSTQREISDNTIQLYGEYGLTNKTTLIANIPFKSIKSGDLVTTPLVAPNTTNGTENRIGNIELGIKHQLFSKKWVASAQLNVEANTGSFDNPTGIRSGYDAWTFTPTFNIGRGFKNYYLQGFTGFNIRTNNYSSNFKIGGEAGYKVIPKLWIIAYVDVVKSFKNGDRTLPISNNFTGLYVNDQEYGAFGLKSIVEITKTFGTNLSFGGAFFGKNVAKKAALNFGVYKKF